MLSGDSSAPNQLSQQGSQQVSFHSLPSKNFS
jgi:hypothetical protein